MTSRGSIYRHGVTPSSVKATAREATKSKPATKRLAKSATATKYIATPFDRKKLSSYDVRAFVPDHAIKTINTPHAHEGDGNKPIWIIWKMHAAMPPVIDTLCDTPDSAVYHYGMLSSEIDLRGDLNQGNISVMVERVPANHRFASSVGHLFIDRTFTRVKNVPFELLPKGRRRPVHEGD